MSENQRLKDFEEIFTLYHTDLCRHVSRIVRDMDAAEDIVQDVFVSFLDKSKKTGIENPYGYLYRACINKALNYFSNSNRRTGLSFTLITRKMRSFRYYSPLLVFFITACTSNPKTMADRDKAEIFEVILSSNDFTSEIARNNDTIYFLENKLTGGFWPGKISKLNIKYIPDTGTARSKNGRWLPDEIKDQRLRYEIKTFNVSADSAYVMIYQYNFVHDCHYKLKKQGTEWVIKLASCGSE